MTEIFGRNFYVGVERFKKFLEGVFSVSLYGLTQKTKFSQKIKNFANAEATSVMMYNSLAQISKEQGYHEISALFKKIANQCAVRAGFYATLNGNYSKDFWELASKLQEGENYGAKIVENFAEELREAGFTDVSDIMKFFANQGRTQAKFLKKIIEKYNPTENKVNIIQNSSITYRCPACGYKYSGDINFEYDDYVCPICGQKKYF